MKVPVFCSLIPTELIIACGHETHLVTAEELAFREDGAHGCSLHENVCSYAKALCDYFERRHGDYGLIIVPTSCDALKKLHNVLRTFVGDGRLYLLDVPKNKDALGGEFFAGSLAKLRERLLRDAPAASKATAPDDRTGEGTPARPATVGIIGSNAKLSTLERVLAENDVGVVYLNHCLVKARPDEGLTELLHREGLAAYAKAFWQQNSCPRTNDEAYKEMIAARVRDEKIEGVVVNAFKFCDFQPFEYRQLKKDLGQDYPMILLEHEFGSNAEGQMKTRIEAFLETIKGVGSVGAPQRRPAADATHVVGIDSGSNATKLVCLDAGGKIVAKLLVPTGTSVARSADAVLAQLEREHGIGQARIARIIGTGYGRENLKVCDATVTEISCHALGAHYRLGRGATIIDVGGQDSKAIRIDPQGNVVRFAMNDKCAAGTGKFLEVMAQKLEVPLEVFAELASNAASSVPISSMCSVFAESEVISLIAEGRPKDGIARGVHKAIAERTASLCRRIAGEAPYYMAGGVAKNAGLVGELSRCLGEEVQVLEDPQFSGALGAAMMAQRSLS